MTVSGLTMTKADRQPLRPRIAMPPHESIGRHQFRALHGALENAMLVPEWKVLQLEDGSRLKVAETAAVNA